MRRNKIFGKVADFISRLTQPASQKRVDHAVYLRYNGGRIYGKGDGVPPEDYGRYLLNTGKHKHYHRKAKLLARAVA